MARLISVTWSSSRVMLSRVPGMSDCRMEISTDTLVSWLHILCVRNLALPHMSRQSALPACIVPSLNHKEVR